MAWTQPRCAWFWMRYGHDASAASVRVYLCLSPCDMRRSFDGLHALVRDHLQLDPFAGHLYLFANRRRDRLKMAL